MRFKTKSLQQAAALMSQVCFPAEYVELEPTSQENKFQFVFDVMASDEEFQKWVLDYMNKKTAVEPKTYDSSLNVLRDNLSHQKSDRRGY